MKCTVEVPFDQVMSGMDVRAGTIDLCDTNGEATEHLIQDRLKKCSGFFIAVLVILGILCLVFGCLSRSSVVLNFKALEFRFVPVTSIWTICAIHIAIVIALVVLMGLRYWFELRMVREHRLSQKMKCDFISQKVDGFLDLLKATPRKDGTHRYEIVIGRKQDPSPTV